MTTPPAAALAEEVREWLDAHVPLTDEIGSEFLQEIVDDLTAFVTLHVERERERAAQIALAHMPGFKSAYPDTQAIIADANHRCERIASAIRQVV